jgi:hypothetical protein
MLGLAMRQPPRLVPTKSAPDAWLSARLPGAHVDAKDAAGVALRKGANTERRDEIFSDVRRAVLFTFILLAVAVIIATLVPAFETTTGL